VPRQLADDYRAASLGERDRAMLDYVFKLTKTPWIVEGADVESLRAADFSDAGILDIVLVAGYYAYVNRLAQGLGVPLEDFWDEEPSGDA
jgi:uncharacterized peroxidase-related enzyme